MKKLIFSFFFTFILLIFIWFILGYSKYGDDVFTKHIDLKSIFESFSQRFYFNYDEFLEALKKFIDVFDFSSYSDLDVLDAIFKILYGLLVAPLEVISYFVSVVVSVVISFFELIFYPKFI